MSNSFTLDHLPPEVDPRQCFSAEEFTQIPQDFSLDAELQKFTGQSAFPTNLEVHQLQIFFDERLCLSWDEGTITFQIFLPENYPTKSMAIAVNGELGYVISDSQVCLNRLNSLDWKLIINKSYVARQRQARH